MKVRFITSKGEWRFASTGKGFFLARLILSLEKLGVECLQTEKGDSDIDMHISRFHYKSRHCKKKVLRLGPVHVDSNKNIKWLNYLKKKALKRCDGVIYQSQFSKKMCNKFIGKAKGKTTVIFNGADPNDYFVKKAVSIYRYNYLASTRDWIGLKRLPQLIEAFISANVEDSALWIAGGLDKNKKVKKDNIFYLGLIEQRKLARYLRLCNTLIHPVYIDASPNSVTEALVAGCSVICSDSGGTSELGYDTVVEDKPWDFKPFNHEKKTPKMNIGKWAQAIRSTKERFPGRAQDLYIDNIAAQYKSFFEEVLNG